eukprot:IDg17887t1
MSDCGEVRTVIVIEICRDRNKETLHLSQARYTAKVLDRFRMSECWPAFTPIESQLPPEYLNGDLIVSTLYR